MRAAGSSCRSVAPHCLRSSLCLLSSINTPRSWGSFVLLCGGLHNADPWHCCSQASVKRPAGGTRERVGCPVPGRSDGSAVVSQSVAMRERRAALHLARLEPGVGFWLAKQRWLWRRDRCGDFIAVASL